MLRAESKSLATPYYPYQFANSQYLPSSSTTASSQPLSTASPQRRTSSTSTSTSTGLAANKKIVCGTCDRAFPTARSLARHSRVHKVEKNHKCPFPGCEKRCLRQDHVQQHYRVHHLSGWGDRLNYSGEANAKKPGAAAAASNPDPPPLLSSPHMLEPTRIYIHHSSPPKYPPPLVPATLPASAALRLPNSYLDGESDRLSSSASPQASYSPTHHGIPMLPQSFGVSADNSAYCSRTSTYQEQLKGAGPFTYVPMALVKSHLSQAGCNRTNAHENFDTHLAYPKSRGNSPISLSSISNWHISHPHSLYSQTHQSWSAVPPSPMSFHSIPSHTSCVPPPAYPGFHDNGNYCHHGHSMIADHPGMNKAHMNSQSHQMYPGYLSNVQNSRVDSPPPILEPIQDERHIRGDGCHSQPHPMSTYIYHPRLHPQPLTTTGYP